MTTQPPGRRMEAPCSRAVATQADSLAAALRAHARSDRAEFDAAYGEARLAYSVRDDDVVADGAGSSRGQ